MFRPQALEDFPLYFVFSSCQLVKGLGTHSLDWVSLGERRQGSFETEPLRSRAFPELPLLNSSHRPIFKYACYIQLRTEKNWRVPILHAKLPRLPDLHATPEEKGTYALFLMLLFRPHREVSEIARPFKVSQAASPQTCSKDKSDDAAWTAVCDEFVRWRTYDIDATAAPYFKKSKSETLLEPRLHGNRENSGRRTWWACMISEKLRNYDTANRLHKVEASLPPQDLEALPVYEYTMSDEAANKPSHPDLNQYNDESQGSRPSEDEDRIQGPEAKKQRCAPTSSPFAFHCENLSLDTLGSTSMRRRRRCMLGMLKVVTGKNLLRRCIAPFQVRKNRKCPSRSLPTTVSTVKTPWTLRKGSKASPRPSIVYSWKE